MVGRNRLGGLALLALAACSTAPEVEPPPAAPGFRVELLRSEPAATPGRCWHSEQRPALFETITEQVLLTPERRDAAGAVTAPASFRSESHQREIRPRETVWFAIPCPGEGSGTANFTASLQRALKARGHYADAVTGEMDGATEAALRRYQAANGLDSAVLSLAAGRALGLIAVHSD